MATCGIDEEFLLIVAELLPDDDLTKLWSQLNIPQSRVKVLTRNIQDPKQRNIALLKKWYTQNKSKDVDILTKAMEDAGLSALAKKVKEMSSPEEDGNAVLVKVANDLPEKDAPKLWTVLGLSDDAAAFADIERVERNTSLLEIWLEEDSSNSILKLKSLLKDNSLYDAIFKEGIPKPTTHVSGRQYSTGKGRKALPKSDHKALPLIYFDNCEWDESNGTLKIKKGVPRRKLIVHDEALDFLNEIEYPLCPVAVVGSHRSGKSYIASQLQEPYRSNTVFKISSDMGSNTMGLWISGEPFLKKLDDGTEVAVILIDSEGLGSVDSDAKWDDVLFTLTVLLTSVLIYNSHGLPKAEDLEKLRCVVNLAERINVGKQSGVYGEEPNTKQFYKFFPNFVWLLRDVTLLPKVEVNGSYKQVDIKEYILKEVLRRIDTTDPSRDTRLAEIGRCVLDFFPIFDACMLSAPSTSPDVTENMDNPTYQGKILPKFLEDVGNFRKVVHKLVKPKKAWPQIGNMNGWQFVESVREYADSLNQSECVTNLKTTWEKIYEKRLGQTVQKAVGQYEKTLDALLQGQKPLEDIELNDLHKSAYDAAIKCYRQETANITDVVLVEKFLKKLKCLMVVYDENSNEINGGILFTKLNRNAEMSKEWCEKVAEDLKIEMCGRVDDGKGKFKSFSAVEEIVNGILDKYDKEARGPAKGATKVEFLKEMQHLLYMAKRLTWLRKLKGFRTHEVAEEQRKIITAQLCAMEEKEKADLLEKRLQELKSEFSAERSIMEANLRRQEEQRKLDLSQMKSDQEHQLENVQVSVDHNISVMEEQYDERKRKLTQLWEDKDRENQAKIDQLTRKMGTFHFVRPFT